MYQVRTEQFEGPLDLLLDLIERNKLSINEISLAKITDEYVEYLRALEQFYPHEVASFLIVAATLMLIKSRSLLPQIELSKEEQSDIQELEKRLELYRRFRDLSKDLRILERGKRRMFGRETYADFPVLFYPPEKLGVEDVAHILADILKALPSTEVLAERTIRAIVSIEEKMEELRHKAEESITKSFRNFVGGKSEKIEVIVSFLAMLELIKQGFILVKQDNLFDDISIEKA